MLELLCIGVLVTVSLALWGGAAYRIAQGGQLIRWTPRPDVPWGLIHLVVIACALLVIQGAAVSVASRLDEIQLGTDFEDLTPQQRVVFLTGASLGSLVTLLLALVIVRQTTGANHRDLGVDARHAVEDCRQGIVAFLMLLLPVFGIQFILTRWLETKHPLVELLRENPDGGYFMLSGISALVVAPVVEEFFFRVFIQGWLEKVAHAVRVENDEETPGAELLRSVWWGQRRAGSHAELDGADSESGSLVGGTRPDTAGVSLRHVPSDTRFSVDGSSRQSVKPATWPILASAILFSLAHFGHGPDPIPLFVLAAGLGYLYQRTHRVTACIVVHFLVNALSMLQLWVAMVR